VEDKCLLRQQQLQAGSVHALIICIEFAKRAVSQKAIGVDIGHQRSQYDASKPEYSLVTVRSVAGLGGG
jgi:hypothetical protein